ncbi:trypsin-like serine peptidase [Kordiimonas lipolytica]|uniref:Trypsin-like serine peptidase n=1 Tax=Kordiimonas lipolytica TaxID=1662421 RepID=A0ABV8UCQ0_9PROT|nr:trypsin-like serine protease [Kordiimonas lipolytica]
MIRTLAIIAFVLLAVPVWAQDQDATMTPEERLKRMRAAEGRVPENVVTSFKRRTVDSSEAPWRAIGRVNNNGLTHCSGTLVGEKLVLTAAHCVYSPRTKKRSVPNNLHFLAGYAKGDYIAHSRVKGYILGKDFNLENAAINPANWSQDWALLILTDPIGADIGFLELHPDLLPGKHTEPELVSIMPQVTTAGYAGDRAHILSLEENCQIVAAPYKGHVLVTTCLSLNGDSGGPILQQLTGGYRVIGITTVSHRSGTKHNSIGVSALAFSEKLGALLAEGR